MQVVMVRTRLRVAVFIDGLNVMFRLRESGWEEFFDICHLASRLAKNRDLVGVHYFRPRPSRPPIRTQQQYWDEMSYLAKVEQDLQTNHGRLIRYGYMRRRGRVWSEKQTDVWVAADMLNGAFKNEYDVAILLTADSDLVPAVEMVNLWGKSVELVTFPKSNPAIGDLLRVVNTSTTARRSWFRPYSSN